MWVGRGRRQEEEGEGREEREENDVGGEGRGGEGWKEKEENDVGGEGRGRREKGGVERGWSWERREFSGCVCTMNHHFCTCIPPLLYMHS